MGPSLFASPVDTVEETRGRRPEATSTEVEDDGTSGPLKDGPGRGRIAIDADEVKSIRVERIFEVLVEIVDTKVER